MRPFLRDGRAAGCEPLGPDGVSSLRLGDILVVERGRRFLAHRLVDIAVDDSGRALLTVRGDRAGLGPETVGEAHIVGKVTGFLWRNGAYLSLDRGASARLHRSFARLSLRLHRLERSGGRAGAALRRAGLALAAPFIRAAIEAVAGFEELGHSASFRARRAEAWVFLRRWAARDIAAVAEPSIQALQAVFDHDLAGWTAPGSLPASARRPLEDQKRRQVGAAIGALAEFERIAGRCASAGLPVLPLKAVSLAYGIYRSDPSVRAFGDIDLLIPPSSAKAFIDCLAGWGYRPKNPGGIRPRSLSIKRKLELLPPPGASGWELDVKLAPVTKRLFARAAGLTSAEVFPRAAAPPGAPPFVRLLDPADEWLYLAQHFILHHRFGGLRWLIDLDRLARALSPEEASTLIRRAGESGLSGIAATALRAVDEIVAPLPSAWDPLRRFRTSLVARAWSTLALRPRAVLERRFRPRRGSRLNKIEEIHWEIPFMDRRVDRFKAFWRRAFPTPAEMDAYWGRRLGPAFLLLWPGHVLVWTGTWVIFLADLAIRGFSGLWTERI
jgi:hypothetical protein